MKRNREGFRNEFDMLELKNGETIVDKDGEKYVLLEKLGAGAMGCVFKIRSERTGIVHAIKFINASMRNLPEYVKRFKMEIRVLGKLNNPFILAANDVRTFEIGKEEVIGLMTDFVEGPTLDDEIAKKDRLEPEQAVTIAAQLAFALETLRRAGIIHRDLKPQNIFLQEMPDGERFVRIGDFGLVGFEFESEFQDEEYDKLDEEFIVGTPEFMSPEIIRKDRLDHRSDLYSLGAVMYKMIVGKPPFRGWDIKLLQAHLKDIPESFIRQGVEDIPAWIEDIVFQLLEKDPVDRYQSAAEVFEAIKKGVAKHYPKLLNEIPFIWNIKPQTYDEPSVQLAA